MSQTKRELDLSMAGALPRLVTARRTGRTVRLAAAERRLALMAADLLLAALLAGAAAVAARAVGQVRPEDLLRALAWNLALALLWVVVAGVNGAYDLRVAHKMRTAAAAVVRTTGMVALLYLAAFYVVGRPITGLEGGRGTSAITVPRVAPFLFLAAAGLFLTLWRLLVSRLLASDALRHRALIVGAGDGGRSFVGELAGVSHPYHLVGFLDDDPEKAGSTVAGLPVLCTRDDLVETVRWLEVEEVVLATRGTLHPDLLRELLRCYELGVRIRPMPAAIEELTGRVPVEHLGQKWFLAPFWNEVGLPLLQATAKRGLDIAVALVGLAVTGLVLPAVAVALKLDSRGSVFYRQERLGRGGRPFLLIKFRSMVDGAEREGEALWARRRDPRVTRLGRFLRQTRLDELPQFWNVLHGEMSVVGPRPERPSFIEQLEREIPFYRMRLAVKPGLSGWAQINQPYANTVAEALRKLEFDLYYVKRQSLLLDVLIILRTLGVVATFRGH